MHAYTIQAPYTFAIESPDKTIQRSAEACSGVEDLCLQTNFGEVKGMLKDFRNYAGDLQINAGEIEGPKLDDTN